MVLPGSGQSYRSHRRALHKLHGDPARARGGGDAGPIQPHDVRPPGSPFLLDPAKRLEQAASDGRLPAMHVAGEYTRCGGHGLELRCGGPRDGPWALLCGGSLGLEGG